MNNGDLAFATGYRPTASKTDLFLACQWPWFRQDIERGRVTEYMRYGSAFHGVLAELIQHGEKRMAPAVDKHAAAYKIDPNKGLVPHVRGSYHRLLKWLGGDNQWGRPFNPKKVYVETAGAVTLKGKSVARDIPPPTEESHSYQAQAHELPGTVDYAADGVLENDDTILVLDHKTGLECDPPAASGQHATLALIWSRRSRPVPGLLRKPKVIVATNHSPREGLPEVFADTLSSSDVDAHEKKLRLAYSRIGDGTLRPGAHCQQCPATSVCPVYGRNLLALAEPTEALFQSARERLRDESGVTVKGGFDLSSPESRGHVHDLLKAYDSMREAIGERLKEAVKAMGPGEKSDGRLLVLRTFERESISMASIKKAYGDIEGERLIRKLRDKGAITKTPIEQLAVEKDRG